jgi:hypothetical protein
MNYVVSQDLLGRYVVARGDNGGHFPWGWSYNPGAGGAKILAAYVMHEGSGHTHVVFVIEGTEVVLEQNALGGGSAPRRRIDEVLASACVLVEPAPVSQGLFNASVQAAIESEVAAAMSRVLGGQALQDDMAAALDAVLKKRGLVAPAPAGRHQDDATCGGNFLMECDLQDGHVGPHRERGQASSPSSQCAACGATKDLPPAVSWAGHSDRICRLLRLCKQCREGVERAMRVDAECEGGQPAVNLSLAGEGAMAIAKERTRQLQKWSEGHDLDEHKNGQLAAAAAGLLGYRSTAVGGSQNRSDWQDRLYTAGAEWAIGLADRHAESRLRQLEIAGALVAAEIDRLKNLEAGA